LALAEVEKPQNGVIPTAISTISRLYTSASAKNLKAAPGEGKITGNSGLKQAGHRE
jgi:hypothetical protein